MCLFCTINETGNLQRKILFILHKSEFTDVDCKDIQAAKRRRRYCEQLWIRTGVLVFVMKCSRSKLHESLHKSICVEILSPMNASHQYAELLATVLRISTI